MITKCCICNSQTESRFRLPFRYLDSISTQIYYQDIGICHNCGFIYVRNPLDDNQLENRYKNFSKYEFDDKNYSFGVNDEYRRRCKRQKDFITRTVSNIGSLLEIGAACGYNLSLYKDEVRVRGIEPSKQNCTHAKSFYKVDMFNGMFSEYLASSESESYNMIFLSHTLEHIVNPSEFISQCSRICDKYIFVEVPSFESKFIDAPFGMFSDEHVNYFTLESLTNLMSVNGFRLVDAELSYSIMDNSPSGYPSISAIFEKTSHRYIPKKYSVNSSVLLDYYIDNNKIEVKKAAEIIKAIPDDMRIAVWGTGNHTSLLLANTDLYMKKIIKFYDSDTRKHGMKLIGKEICPFNENDIMNGDIDGILVGTYTAQTSIYNILRKYENKCKIYLLYDI